MNTRMSATHWRIWWAPLLLAGVITFLCGCRVHDDAKQLAVAGSESTRALAGYYDTLVQDTVDTWELEAIFRGTANPPIPFSTAEQRLYQERIDALSTRAQLARDFSACYASIEQLAEADSTTTISQAYTHTTPQLQELPALPGSRVTPETLLVLKGLADWKQTSDLRKANALALQQVKGLSTLFNEERAAYQLIGTERHDVVSAVGRRLLEQKKLNGRELLERIPVLVGLPWANGQPALDDAGTINTMVVLLTTRSERRKIQSERIAVNMATALEGLVQSHAQFQQQKAIRLNDVLPYAREAQRFVNELKSSPTKDQPTGGKPNGQHP